MPHGRLRRRQLDLEAALPGGEPVFLDRGLVDICHFGELRDLPCAEDPQPGTGIPPYDLVFYVEPLPEHLFQRTGIRDMTWAEALRLNEQLIAHYQRHGYRLNLVRVPFAPLTQRVEVILAAAFRTGQPEPPVDSGPCTP